MIEYYINSSKKTFKTIKICDKSQESTYVGEKIKKIFKQH